MSPFTITIPSDPNPDIARFVLFADASHVYVADDEGRIRPVPHHLAKISRVFLQPSAEVEVLRRRLETEGHH